MLTVRNRKAKYAPSPSPIKEPIVACVEILLPAVLRASRSDCGKLPRVSKRLRLL